MAISLHGIMNKKKTDYYALIKSNMNDILHPIPEKWTSLFFGSTFPFVDFLKMDTNHQPVDDLIILILKRGNINPLFN